MSLFLRWRDDGRKGVLDHNGWCLGVSIIASRFSDVVADDVLANLGDELLLETIDVVVLVAGGRLLHGDGGVGFIGEVADA